ncbi:cupin domain-containing protein [Opitutaceae bacterium]
MESLSLVALSPATHTAAEVVTLLGLQPLDQEGGWFRRTSESGLVIPSSALPSAHGGPRRAYSVIHALFTPDGFSALHRLISDEIWCFHAGDPLESLRLYPDGRGEWVQLGLAPAAGLRVQDVVGANVWQGTRLVVGGRWALVSCTVVPEFVWADFELAERAALAAAYPAFVEGIVGLTRDAPPVGHR